MNFHSSKFSGKQRHLPPHSAIFFVLMNVDAAGITHETGNALKRLSSSANAPIFSSMIPFLERRSLADRCYSVRREVDAAAVAIRILGGEKAGSINTPAIQYALPRFDWRQMRRWGISQSTSLQAARSTSESQPYGNGIPGKLRSSLRLFSVQAGLITILLREHRRRQFAEVQSRQRMAELAHVNRFSTAGELTASIAHEINQPLGTILTNAETARNILKSSSPDIAELRDIVDDILQDDQRATEVIQRMRSLLKKAPFELKKFDLNDLARETVEFFPSWHSGERSN